MDRRDESNVDEFYKLGSLRDLREMALEPSFVVTGNQPVVIRESLLPRAFEMAEGTVAASYNLEDGSRGMLGPFCLETIVTTNWNSRSSKSVPELSQVQTRLSAAHRTRTSTNRSCPPVDESLGPSARRWKQTASMRLFRELSHHSKHQGLVHWEGQPNLLDLQHRHRSVWLNLVPNVSSNDSASAESSTFSSVLWSLNALELLQFQPQAHVFVPRSSGGQVEFGDQHDGVPA